MLGGGYGEQGLQAAILVACAKHLNVLDKNGEPYILHPLRVMAAVQHLGHEAMIKAVLHDCVEDTDMTLEDVLLGWGPDVHRGMDALTHRKGKNGGPKETYFEYVRRCRDSGDPHTVEIKLKDINDNKDPNRAFGDGSEKASMLRRYEKAERILARLEE